MIVYFVRRLMAKKAAEENRRLTLTEVSDATGIGRVTLTRIADHPNYNAEAENLDKLCAYFGCKIEELVEYRPDTEAAKPSQRPRKTVPTAATKKAATAKKARK